MPPGKKKNAKKTASYLALALMQAIPDAVIAFDTFTRVVFANDAAQALFHKGEKALAETTVAQMLEKEDAAVLDALESVIRTGVTVNLHDVSVRDRYAHRVVIRPLEDEGLYLMAVTLHAVHLKTEWANKARHGLKPARLMLRTLAHEIKNPLAGIQAAAQLLAKGKLSFDDTELVTLISRETERIARLIGKVDVFGDAQPENYKPVNIHEVLSQVAQVARTAFGPGVRVEEKYDPSLPNLHGDFDHLVQAQMNIVKNAAEALEGGKGKISIRTFYDNAAAWHPDSREKLPLCIEIEDEGRGMDEATLRRAFDPYFSTKPGGDGLGLSVVSKIVDDHGGTIDVKSEPGKTVFRFNFPLGGRKG